MAQAAFRLEYQDLVIPLTISVLHWRHPDYVSAATPRVQPIIRAYLKDAAGDGWRPDEPTDFPTLFSRSRVRTRITGARKAESADALRRWETEGGAVEGCVEQSICAPVDQATGSILQRDQGV